MFEYKKWLKDLTDSVERYRDSAEAAVVAAEDVLIERTDQSTATLTGDLLDSRKTEIKKTRDGVQLEISFETPYAIEQHEAPYNHDLRHNSSEVRGFTGGVPLRYLARPLIDERDVLWKRIYDKVGFK